MSLNQVSKAESEIEPKEEQPVEQPKEQPVEQPKEQPVEQPKEQPKAEPSQIDTVEEKKEDKHNEKYVKKNGKKHGRPDYSKKYRKKLSSEDEEKLKNGLIESLPDVLINNNDTLHIYIDGYNISGCDRLCRDLMYKSKGTKYKARQRMAELIQYLFIEKIKLKYNIVMHLWFDGHIDKQYTQNNKSIEIYKDIEITHTPINYVVDDKLVDEFSKINKDKNCNKLVITSDRELIIRLYECGVYSMKSGRFYKQFLKEN
eukprot:236787_1